MPAGGGDAGFNTQTGEAFRSWAHVEFVIEFTQTYDEDKRRKGPYRMLSFLITPHSLHDFDTITLQGVFRYTLTSVSPEKRT